MRALIVLAILTGLIASALAAPWNAGPGEIIPSGGSPTVGNLLLVGGGNVLLVGGGKLQCVGSC